MSGPTIPLCAECAEPLPPRKPGPGKQRVYCCDRCRKRAERRRKAVEQWQGLESATLTPLVGRGESPPPSTDPVAPPDEQLVVAVLELHTVAGILRHLSRELRPQLSWRAEKLAEALTASLGDFFPVK